jgi:transposase
MNDKQTHWVGMDVSKKTFDAGLVFDGQHYPGTLLREVPAESFDRTPEGVDCFLAWLDQHMAAREQSEEVRVVMEATGSYSVELAAWILERRASLRPAIVNPHRTASFLKSLGLRNKTDRVEARALAFYGAERNPAPYEPSTPARADLRALSRYRDTLVNERVAAKNREDDISLNKMVRAIAARRLRQLDRDIKAVETRMKALVQKVPELEQDIRLLVTIPGVAFVTACVMLAEMGDMRRFERARQVSAFAGVSPRFHQSGTSVNARPRMCKSGNPRIRQALYLSAMVAARVPGELRNTHARLVDAGKSKMAALGALMRKLLILMRAILIANKPYDKHYNSGNNGGKIAACGG